jgi:phosphodiesterase/alkaline phosphatase D-like protein
MMGNRQENWFYRQLIDSKTRGATWRVIGSQTGEQNANCLRSEMTDGPQSSPESMSLLHTEMKILWYAKTPNSIFVFSKLTLF